MRWVQNPNLQQKILDWNDGFQNGRGDVPAIVAATKCTPLFVSDNELESCVDNGNGSRVARDLAEVTGGGGGRLLQKISGGSEVIPWEPHGIRVSLGKMKEEWGRCLKRQRERRGRNRRGLIEKARAVCTIMR